MASRAYGDYSGVAAAVARVGERWALLIVRDLLVGPRRYTDLKQSLPRIPTNILSTRLKELQEAGVVHRVPIMNCGLVYELTAYGRELEPIVLALERWGSEQLGAPGEDRLISADGLTIALRAAFRDAPGATGVDVELHASGVVLRVQVQTGELRIAQLAPAAPPVGGRLPDGQAPLAIELEAGWQALLERPAPELADSGVRVLRGDPALVTGFVAAFSRAARPVADA